MSGEDLDLLEALDEERTSRKDFLARASAVSLATLLGPSAGTALAGRGKSCTLAFGQPDRGAAVVQGLYRAAHAEAKKYGCKLLESFAYGSAAKQVSEANTWIAQGVDAIAILPLDEGAMGPLVKKAHSKGIKFVGYADAIPGNDGYITWNNKQGAKLVGQHIGRWVNKTLGGKAEVALLTAEFHKTGRERIHGAQAALQQVAPGAKVVAKQEAVLAADALKAMQSILQAHPKINVVICIADDGCIGARQAMLATGRPTSEMYITGFDGSKPALDFLLKKGDPIRSVGALDIAFIGKATVDLMYNLVQGKGQKQVLVPYVLATQDTPAVVKRLLKAYPA